MHETWLICISTASSCHNHVSSLFLSSLGHPAFGFRTLKTARHLKERSPHQLIISQELLTASPNLSSNLLSIWHFVTRALASLDVNAVSSHAGPISDSYPTDPDRESRQGQHVNLESVAPLVFCDCSYTTSPHTLQFRNRDCAAGGFLDPFVQWLHRTWSWRPPAQCLWLASPRCLTPISPEQHPRPERLSKAWNFFFLRASWNHSISTGRALTASRRKTNHPELRGTSEADDRKR